MLKCTFELSEQLHMIIDNKGLLFYTTLTDANLNILYIAHANVSTEITSKII